MDLITSLCRLEFKSKDELMLAFPGTFSQGEWTRASRAPPQSGPPQALGPRAGKTYNLGSTRLPVKILSTSVQSSAEDQRATYPHGIVTNDT